MAWLHLPLRSNEEEPLPIRYDIIVNISQASLIHSSTGLGWDQVADDPELGSKRGQLVREAASRLSDARMIVYERETGRFTITDLGRIAAKYYIRYASIEIFNQVFRPSMTEADVLAMLCRSTEVGSTSASSKICTNSHSVRPDTSERDRGRRTRAAVRGSALQSPGQWTLYV